MIHLNGLDPTIDQRRNSLEHFLPEPIRPLFSSHNICFIVAAGRLPPTPIRIAHQLTDINSTLPTLIPSVISLDRRCSDPDCPSCRPRQPGRADSDLPPSSPAATAITTRSHYHHWPHQTTPSHRQQHWHVGIGVAQSQQPMPTIDRGSIDVTTIATVSITCYRQTRLSARYKSTRYFGKQHSAYPQGRHFGSSAYLEDRYASCYQQLGSSAYPQGCYPSQKKVEEVWYSLLEDYTPECYDAQPLPPSPRYRTSLFRRRQARKAPLTKSKEGAIIAERREDLL
ncbi:hypothetical protein ACLOJK_004401 [Asimina triloba]